MNAYVNEIILKFNAQLQNCHPKLIRIFHSHAHGNMLDSI